MGCEAATVGTEIVDAFAFEGDATVFSSTLVLAMCGTRKSAKTFVRGNCASALPASTNASIEINTVPVITLSEVSEYR